jgi:hypothetical protein
MSMKRWTIVALCALALTALAVQASSPLSVIAIVDNVVFEPAQGEPERARVFGRFAFFDGRGTRLSPASGYLYFSLPADGNAALVRREWADLAAAAGTGESVAFGRYEFLGTSVVRGSNGRIVEVPLWVYPADDEPSEAVEYYAAGIGVVRLGKGNYDEIVANLRRLTPAAVPAAADPE